MKKELQIGSQFYPLHHMDLPFTKMPSMMHSASATAGDHLICYLLVPAEPNSTPVTHSPAPREALPPLGITRFVTCWPICSQKYVTMLLLNLTYNMYNHSQVRCCPVDCPASTDDDVRLDIAVIGFWGGRFERTFFDVRVFNPHAPSNQNSQISTTYRRHEREKPMKYEQRIVEVEHASFVPFVLSCTGGAGPSATVTLKRLGVLSSHFFVVNLVLLS